MDVKELSDEELVKLRYWAKPPGSLVYANKQFEYGSKILLPLLDAEYRRRHPELAKVERYEDAMVEIVKKIDLVRDSLEPKMGQGDIGQAMADLNNICRDIEKLKLDPTTGHLLGW